MAAMAEIPVASTFHSILEKFLPELNETVKVHEFLTMLEKYTEDTDGKIDAIRTQQSNEEGINKLIQIAGSKESYFVSFIQILLKLDDKYGCGYIAHKILRETDAIDPNIKEIFCSPKPKKQLEVQPNEKHTSADKEASGENNDGQPLANRIVTEQSKSQIENPGPGTKNLVKVHIGTEIDDLENRKVTMLVNELSKVDELTKIPRWEILCNRFLLQRRDVKGFEKSSNPSKKFLDFIGEYSVASLAQCLQDANMTDILQKIPIEFIPESPDQKLRSLDNETFTKLSEDLNKDRKWEKLANKLGLMRKDVLKLERREDPAKSLLDMHCHIEIDKLYEMIRGINDTSVVERNTSSSSESHSTATTEGSNKNDLNRPRLRPLEIQERNIEASLMQNHTPINRNSEETYEKSLLDESPSDNNEVHLNANDIESNIENANARQTSIVQLQSGVANSSDKSVQVNFSYDELEMRSNTNNVITCPENEPSTGLNNITSHENESSTGLNNITNPGNEPITGLNNITNPENEPSTGLKNITSPENEPSTRLTNTTNPGNELSTRLTNITSPENDHASDKNIEQTCNDLLNDTYAQSKGTGYRDIQNSLPDLNTDESVETLDLARSVVAPENGLAENNSQDGDLCQLNTTNHIANPESESNSIEKTPEQNCEALINDAKAQYNGNGYRDIQNSLPSNI